MSHYLVIPIEGEIVEHNEHGGLDHRRIEGVIGTDALTVVTVNHPAVLDRDLTWVLWIDDWGATNELPVNWRAWALYGRSPIHGPALLVDDQRLDLPEDLVAWITSPDFPGDELMATMRQAWERRP